MKLQGSGPSAPKSLQSQNRPRPENRLSISRLDVVHGQLRDQIDKRLLELRAELEKQLAALGAKGKSRISSSLKGKKVPPKYRSAKGETWAGRGQRPRWMVEAMKKGKKMDDFLIERHRL
jgi:DNA-binding protein H-NS